MEDTKNNINKAITLQNGKVFFGDKEVMYSGYYDGGSYSSLDKIRRQYVIRVKDDSSDGRPYWSIATTMDIASHGLIWLCGYTLKGSGICDPSPPSAFYNQWSSVEYILNNLCRDTAGKEWAIFEEEPPSHDKYWGDVQDF